MRCVAALPQRNATRNHVKKQRKPEKKANKSEKNGFLGRGKLLPAAGYPAASAGPVWAASPDPLKGIPKAYRKPIGALKGMPIGAMGTGAGPAQSGPEITRGYILIISGAKYYFYNRFFALISNF